MIRTWLVVMAVVVVGGAAADDAPRPVRLKTRIAVVQRFRPGQWPEVDGRVVEAAWQGVRPLDAFIPFAGVEGKAKAETRVWVAYDDARLYLGFRCREPAPDQMRSTGSQRDDYVAGGDSIHLFIAAADLPDPHYHFAINPKNLRWDAFVNGQTVQTEYDGEWESAVAVGRGEWCAEMAIPWSALKRDPPLPGTRINANLCRRRIAEDERTSWSQCQAAFEEPDHFGTWVLR